MNHQVKFEDIDNYCFSHEISASYGGGIDKSLVAVVTGNEVDYQVLSHSEVIFQSLNLDQAVKQYNEIKGLWNERRS